MTTLRVLVVSVIHGLGGIGKSTLAAALAHDLEVQQRLPDGVLWVTLGQQPDVLSLLSGWIQILGHYGLPYQNGSRPGVSVKPAVPRRTNPTCGTTAWAGRSTARTARRTRPAARLTVSNRPK